MGFRALFSLAVGKWIAVAFGTTGTALFGQLMNLFTAFCILPNDGLARSIIRESAVESAKEDAERVRQVAWTGLVLMLVIFALEWLVSGLIGWTTQWFDPFQSAGYLYAFQLAFGILSASYLMGTVFLVWKKANLQAIQSTFLSLGGLVGVVVIGLLGGGIMDCLLGFLGGQAAGGFLVFFWLRNKIPLGRPHFKWDPVLGKRLLKFAFTLASIGLLNQIGIYGLVHWALETMGTDKVGLWMAMNRFADAFNTPILAVANSILLPLLSSQIGNQSELRKILRPIFFQSLGVLGLGMLILFLAYPILLPILFSKEFQADTPWIAWQLAGDFFRSNTYVISILILAFGHTRFYFFLESGSVAMLLLLSYFLFDRFGYVGMFMAHFIRYALYWLVIVWHYRKIFF